MASMFSIPTRRMVAASTCSTPRITTSISSRKDAMRRRWRGRWPGCGPESPITIDSTTLQEDTNMKYADVNGKLADYRRQIGAIRERMRETLATVEPQEVSDYEFTTVE